MLRSKSRDTVYLMWAMPGRGEDGDLLPGHDLGAGLDRHRRQGRHVGQGLLPLHGRPAQRLYS
jgi:hypothetical protein